MQRTGFDSDGGQRSEEMVPSWNVRPASRAARSALGRPRRANWTVLGLFLLASFVASCATAPTLPPKQRPLIVAGDVVPPTPIEKAAPQYPEAARTAKIQGEVILDAVIGDDGSVESVKVTKSVPGLDQAALDAVKSWKYIPATLNGAPVRVRFTAIVKFKLGKPVNVETEGESPEPRTVIGDVVAPVPTYKPDPVYPEDARLARIEGKVIVEAIVETDGAVTNLKIRRSHPNFDQAALNAIAQWKYRPATLYGEPVRVRFTIIVTFRLEEDTPPPPPATGA